MPRHSTLNRQGPLTEPGGDLWGEAWREGAVNVLVVGVEPVDFGAVEKILDDDGGVEVAEGQRLESQPMAEIILSGINAKNEVLVTDAELAFTVDSRLVARDHAGEQSLTVEVLTDVLRAFVNIQIKSDPWPVPWPKLRIAFQSGSRAKASS